MSNQLTYEEKNPTIGSRFASNALLAAATVSAVVVIAGAIIELLPVLTIRSKNAQDKAWKNKMKLVKAEYLVSFPNCSCFQLSLKNISRKDLYLLLGLLF